MTVRQLRQLLRQGEGEQLEFKEASIKSSDLAETLTAMANARGGIVLLGVNDFGQPVGVPSVKEAKDLLETAARECATPPLVLRTSDVQLPRGQLVLVGRVGKAHQPVLSGSGRLLIRRGSRNVPASAAEAAQLFSEAGAEQGAFAYEILWHNLVLQITDAKGQRATLTRTARVRFLQRQVLALHDRVWGQGDLSLEPYVRPGRIVDRFRQDSEVHHLVSLREAKRRGETSTIEVVHAVRDVFTRPCEWFDVDVDMPTRWLRVEIRFPADRPPKEGWLSDTRTGRKLALSGSQLVRTRAGARIVWRRRAPTLHERLRTEWCW